MRLGGVDHDDGLHAQPEAKDAVDDARATAAPPTPVIAPLTCVVLAVIIAAIPAAKHLPCRLRHEGADAKPIHGDRGWSHDDPTTRTTGDHRDRDPSPALESATNREMVASITRPTAYPNPYPNGRPSGHVRAHPGPTPNWPDLHRRTQPDVGERIPGA